MSKFELSDFFPMDNAFGGRRIPSKRALLCSHCKEDVNKRNLISPCNCINKFIHVHCLKTIANTQSIISCQRCKTRYPLEIQRKSLLKMLGNVCKYYFAILFAIILLISIIGPIFYSVSLQVLDLLNIQFLFIVQISILGIFLCLTIYMIVHQIVDWSYRIYEHYYQWYKSTYEWRLIRPSTVNNIEEIKI